MPRLYMLRLTVDLPKLHVLVHRQGVPTCPMDMGYFLHCGFSALVDGPKPFVSFKVETARGPKAQVLAYSHKSRKELQMDASLFADPDAYSLIDWESMSEKPMPETWPTDHPFGFQVLVCPTVRIPHPEKKGSKVEVDSYLREGPDCPDRRTAYHRWLQEAMQGTQLLRVGLDAFSIEPMLRRTHTQNRSNPKSLKKPVAQLSGSLTIQDPEAFQALLSSGVGRHRAFGFGMLFLHALR